MDYSHASGLLKVGTTRGCSFHIDHTIALPVRDDVEERYLMDYSDPLIC